MAELAGQGNWWPYVADFFDQLGGYMSGSSSPSAQEHMPLETDDPAAVETFAGSGDPENPNFWDIVGNWFTGNLDYARDLQMMREQQAYNANQAQLEREWARFMRQMEYQDTVKSIEAAGLNPNLLYSMGAGGLALTPSAPGARSPGSSRRGERKLGLADILTVLVSFLGTAASAARAASAAGAQRVANDVAISRLSLDAQKFKYLRDRDQNRRR